MSTRSKNYFPSLFFLRSPMVRGEPENFFRHSGVRPKRVARQRHKTQTLLKKKNMDLDILFGVENGSGLSFSKRSFNNSRYKF